VRVNATTRGNQFDPAIATDGKGNFVITWSSVGQDGSGYGIYAQQFEIAFEIASVLSFSQPTYQIGENGVPIGAQVTVTRSSDLHLASQVAYEITSGTATNGSDYTLPQSDFISFQPGESSKTITIPILQDTLIEGDETIVMRLLEVQGGNAILQGNREATITILDDDRPSGGINQPGQPQDPLLPQPPNTAPIGAPIGAPVGLPNLSPVPGMRSLRGTNRKDTLTGTNAGEMLVGLRGNDRLNGRGGNDILIGVNPNTRTPGRNEIDQLTGGPGRDLFVLGDQQRVFYDDGKRNSAGLKDYALIKDFNRQQDAIQLHGKVSDYRLGSAPQGLPKGNAIFLETGRTDELIAIVQGNGKLDLNSSMFQFV
jgi:Ca2+-binding RTX toxin-like protein